jgi:hypothetical protein
MIRDLHSGNVIAAPFHENHRLESAGTESTNSCDTGQCGKGSQFFLKFKVIGKFDCQLTLTGEALIHIS